MSGKEIASVTADGVKTYNELLSELFELIDLDKITLNSKLRIGDAIYTLETKIPTALYYSLYTTRDARTDGSTLILGSTSYYYYTRITAASVTYTEMSSNVAAANSVIKVYS